MENSEGADITDLEEDKKVLLEFLWFVVFGFGWLLFETLLKPTLNGGSTEDYEFRAGLICFGLLHIAASNALSFLYNLSRHVLPFLKSPLATPKRLKILGALIIIFAVCL